MDLKAYTALFNDESGQELGRTNVLAAGYQAALKKLGDVPDGTSRIEVIAGDGTKAGEVGVRYWRQRLRR